MKADQDEIANLTAEVAKIDKDLNASKATERNISDNIRYREMRREIEEFQREIASLNLDEAARSNRTFTEKYDACRRKENELNGEVCIMVSRCRVR